MKAGKSENNPDKDGTVVMTLYRRFGIHRQRRSCSQSAVAGHSVIAGIQRGPMEIVPRGDTIIRSGDTLLVIAEKEYLQMIVDAYQIISGEVEVDIPL